MENQTKHSSLEDCEEEKQKEKKSADKKRNIFFVAIFVLLIAGSYAYSYRKNNNQKIDITLKEKTEKFIKENLVQPGTDFKITEFTPEGDLYKLNVAVGSQNITSYVTKDGKKFFPQVVDLEKGVDKTPASNSPKVVAEALQKKDVPDVELFVMSYCPYGVQAEKGILPVVQKLGSKINFSVKFVDYTLHGKKEFDENLNQYCIQKEEPKKYNDYLACFTKEGDFAKCATSASIDAKKVASCVSATDKQFKLTENLSTGAQSSPFGIYKDLNDKYGVQGSPSLVVNGQLLDAGRDSASLLKTICSGFNNQPAECQATLPSDTPAPGFGDGKTAPASANPSTCGQ